MKRSLTRGTMVAIFAWLIFVETSQAQEVRVRQHAKGEFTVSLQPLTFEGADAGSKLGRMSIDKQITGDLVASTKGQMLSARTDTEGSAGYVAIEVVSGTLNGKNGTFVLQHTGSMNRGEPSLSVVVVPDSGTGELTGISGNFKVISEGGKHHYDFSYSLPDEQ